MGFAAILPAGTEVEESTVDENPDALFPSEKTLIADAVPERALEFATGRACARRALGRLGWRAEPILVGRRREPLWPSGVVGSITHCEGLRAAAVARATDLFSLGIDAEVNERLPAGTIDLLTVGGEPGMLSALFLHDPAVAWDRLLFSAKESIYKAWFPLADRWLDFTACELVIHRDGTFVGEILVDGVVVGASTLQRFTGRWTVTGAHILTAVWVVRAS